MLAVTELDLKPKFFWNLSWYDCSVYMFKLSKQRKKEELKEEKEWERIRELWVPIVNAHFKKPGGGKFEATDLIKLSFDKKNGSTQEKPSLETFERLAKKHGKRKKKNGK